MLVVILARNIPVEMVGIELSLQVCWMVMNNVRVEMQSVGEKVGEKRRKSNTWKKDIVS
jgi:hypothetical protein